MNDPAILANLQQMISITKESGQLEPVVVRYQDYLKAKQSIEELKDDGE